MLPPDDVQQTLRARLKSLRRVMVVLRESIKDSPDGRLRIAVHNGRPQWYCVTKESDSKGEYIRQKDEALARQLAQKGYSKDALAELRRQETEITRFLKRHTPARLNELFEKMHTSRRALTTPLTLSPDEYARQWLSAPYVKKAFAPDEPVLQTARGERMRSKSELLIADVLASLQIPYRYEYPHRLKIPLAAGGFGAGGSEAGGFDAGGSEAGAPIGSRKKVFYPDFTCLNVRTRQEFIWEHFGLMDKPEYARNAMDKLDIYEANGFFYGDGLIFTKEFEGAPLNPVQVRRLAEKFLK